MFPKIFRKSLTATISYPSPKHSFSSLAHKQKQQVSREDTNDATSQLIRSVQSTIKGLTHINDIVEHDPNLAEEEKLRKKRFLIYKYNPADENDTAKLVSYYVDLTQISPMYLDALIYIKDNLDSTLTFRRSCREGICGSCSMNCDGLQTLACIRPINRDLTKPAIMSPLGHMFVLKDLVVDMTNFYIQHKTVSPYLKRKTPKAKGEENKELYQSPEERKLLDGLYECILCACCSTSCPSYWWRPDRYLGPAALLQAYRWIQDSRDEFKDERLEVLAKGDRLTDCVNIGMCTFTCPKNLDPQSAINDLFVMVRKLKESKTKQEDM